MQQKTALRGKLIVINASLRKTEDPKQPKFTPQETRKGEQTKPKVIERKIRAEVNDLGD